MCACVCLSLTVSLFPKKKKKEKRYPMRKSDAIKREVQWNQWIMKDR